MSWEISADLLGTAGSFQGANLGAAPATSPGHNRPRGSVAVRTRRLRDTCAGVPGGSKYTKAHSFHTQQIQPFPALLRAARQEQKTEQRKAAGTPKHTSEEPPTAVVNSDPLDSDARMSAPAAWRS